MKNFMRLQQACRGLAEFIRSNTRISVYSGKWHAIYFDEPTSSWQLFFMANNRNGCKTVDIDRFCGIHFRVLGCLSELVALSFHNRFQI